MAVTREAFRTALGTFATGVCVITCPGGEGEEPCGLTANSFTSVSLDPPLVLWCIDKASDRFESFHAAGVHGISILAEDQTSLSVAFAGDGAINGAPILTGRLGAPLIDGAAAQIECRIVARHDAGDHVILVGEVADLTVDPAKAPLVFHGGQYRRLQG